MTILPVGHYCPCTGWVPNQSFVPTYNFAPPDVHLAVGWWLVPPSPRLVCVELHPGPSSGGRIFGTPFVVDDFTSTAGLGSPMPGFPNVYLLTHAHADHMHGLTEHWARGSIYCSRITKAMVRHALPKIDPKWMVEVEAERVYTINNGSTKITSADGFEQEAEAADEGEEIEERESNQTGEARDGGGELHRKRHFDDIAAASSSSSSSSSTSYSNPFSSASSSSSSSSSYSCTSSFTLTPFDSHHCPGSLMFHLRSPHWGSFFHTGDCRFDRSFEPSPLLRSLACNVDRLYFDSTFCGQEAEFPSREEATAVVVREIRSVQKQQQKRVEEEEKEREERDGTSKQGKGASSSSWNASSSSSSSSSWRASASSSHASSSSSSSPSLSSSSSLSSPLASIDYRIYWSCGDLGTELLLSSVLSQLDLPIYLHCGGPAASDMSSRASQLRLWAKLVGDWHFHDRILTDPSRAATTKVHLMPVKAFQQFAEKSKNIQTAMSMKDRDEDKKREADRQKYHSSNPSLMPLSSSTTSRHASALPLTLYLKTSAQYFVRRRIRESQSMHSLGLSSLFANPMRSKWQPCDVRKMNRDLEVEMERATTGKIDTVWVDQWGVTHILYSMHSDLSEIVALISLLQPHLLLPIVVPSTFTRAEPDVRDFLWFEAKTGPALATDKDVVKYVAAVLSTQLTDIVQDVVGCDFKPHTYRPEIECQPQAGSSRGAAAGRTADAEGADRKRRKKEKEQAEKAMAEKALAEAKQAKEMEAASYESTQESDMGWTFGSSGNGETDIASFSSLSSQSPFYHLSLSPVPTFVFPSLSTVEYCFPGRLAASLAHPVISSFLSCCPEARLRLYLVLPGVTVGGVRRPTKGNAEEVMQFFDEHPVRDERRRFQVRVGDITNLKEMNIQGTIIVQPVGRLGFHSGEGSAFTPHLSPDFPHWVASRYGSPALGHPCVMPLASSCGLVRRCPGLEAVMCARSPNMGNRGKSGLKGDGHKGAQLLTEAYEAIFEAWVEYMECDAVHPPHEAVLAEVKPMPAALSLSLLLTLSRSQEASRSVFTQDDPLNDIDWSMEGGPEASSNENGLDESAEADEAAPQTIDPRDCADAHADADAVASASASSCYAAVSAPNSPSPSESARSASPPLGAGSDDDADRDRGPECGPGADEGDEGAVDVDGEEAPPWVDPELAAEAEAGAEAGAEADRRKEGGRTMFEQEREDQRDESKNEDESDATAQNQSSSCAPRTSSINSSLLPVFPTFVFPSLSTVEYCFPGRLAASLAHPVISSFLSCCPEARLRLYLVLPGVTVGGVRRPTKGNAEEVMQFFDEHPVRDERRRFQVRVGDITNLKEMNIQGTIIAHPTTWRFAGGEGGRLGSYLRPDFSRRLLDLHPSGGSHTSIYLTRLDDETELVRRCPGLLAVLSVLTPNLNREMRDCIHGTDEYWPMECAKKRLTQAYDIMCRSVFGMVHRFLQHEAKAARAAKASVAAASAAAAAAAAAAATLVLADAPGEIVELEVEAAAGESRGEFEAMPIGAYVYAGAGSDSIGTQADPMPVPVPVPMPMPVKSYPEKWHMHSLPLLSQASSAASSSQSTRGIAAIESDESGEERGPGETV